MNEKKLQAEKELRQRVIALLTREQIDFLNKLGEDALFSCGKKLTHTKIISFLVDILIRLGINGKDIKTSEDLEKKIKQATLKNLFTQALTTEQKNSTGIEQEVEKQMHKIDNLEKDLNLTAILPKIKEKENGTQL